MAGINTKDFCKEMKTGAFILDIQTSGDYAEAHIKDAFNIPASEVKEAIEDLPTEGKILVVDKDGASASEIVDFLTSKSLDAAYLEGGIEKGWKAFRLPTQHSCAT